MGTFGSEMQKVAQLLTEKFSEEIGESTLVHVTAGVYDPETGTATPTLVEETAYMAFMAIKDSEVSDVSFTKDHAKAVVAGDDIITHPAIGDFIIKPAGTKHRIVKVSADQYEAAYIMYVEKNGS